MNLGLGGANWAACKNPIDGASAVKQGLRRCRSELLVGEGTFEVFVSEFRNGIITGNVQIHVARKHDGSVRFVRLRILKAFTQLSLAQICIPTTLEVHVIADQPSSSQVDIDDQGHPSADSLLKRLRVRKIPTRSPEIRLPLELQDTCVR